MGNGESKQSKRRKRRITLPGRARTLVQIYEPGRRIYGQPAGMSLANIEVEDAQELERLWQSIRDAVHAGGWRNAVRRREAEQQHAAAS